MAISFTYEIMNDSIHITSEGFDESLDDVKNYLKNIIDICERNKILKVLCDERKLEYRLNTLDTYKLAEYISGNVPLTEKIALVADRKYSGDIQFYENTAFNRGLTINIFYDIKEASDWLEGNK